MKAVVAFTLVTAVAAAAGGTRGFSYRRGVLSAAMQPEVVAKSLSKVEEAWKAQAVEFSNCHQCPGPAAAFGKSCSTVMRAVVQASAGDRAVASDYMGDVCSQPVLAGWKQDRCKKFGKTVTAAMAQDGVGKHLDVANVCQSFWATVIAEDGAEPKVENTTVSESETAKQAAAKAKADDEAKEEQISKEVDAAEANVDQEADDAKSLIAKVEAAPKSEPKVEAPKSEPKVTAKVAPKKESTAKADTFKVADAAEASIRASKLARAALKKAAKAF